MPDLRPVRRAKRSGAQQIATRKERALSTGQSTLEGILSSIIYRTTRQGRHWASATLQSADDESEILFYPHIYEVLRGEVREGAAVQAVTDAVGHVTSMNIADHRWEDVNLQPDDSGERAAFIAVLRETKEVE